LLWNITVDTAEETQHKTALLAWGPTSLLKSGSQV
jgi:hypothetical protein